jgi:hypothetical protein
MIKFEHVKTYNWLDAIRGMRNSWESWGKMDSEVSYLHDREFLLEKPRIGTADHKLMMTLVKAGSDHAKFMRQILISVDVIAPEYWWKEADTYKVGTVANSTSMMHTLGKSEITRHDFSFEDVPAGIEDRYIEMLNELRDRWVESGKKKPSPEWRAMNQLTAIGFNYRRTFTCNYAVLRSMYHSRKNHRLSEWHDFCAWCETLPYSELITYSKEDK